MILSLRLVALATQKPTQLSTTLTNTAIQQSSNVGFGVLSRSLILHLRVQAEYTTSGMRRLAALYFIRQRLAGQVDLTKHNHIVCRKHMRRGILYLAKGEQFRRDVRQAARQVKEVMPNVPISIVTDKDLDDQLFDEVIVDRAEFETSDKPRVLQRTPYDRTIFLDTDIHLHSTIDELFDILNEFDLALVRDHMECNVPSTDQGSTDGVPEAFPELNSGVIAYVDCPEVIEFFKDWKRRCHSDHDYDQRSLRPALYHSDVRLTMLPPRYNCLYSVVGCVNGEVKAFHTALGNRDRIAVDTEEAVRKLNAIERPRTYRPYEDTLLVDLAPPPLLKLWITLQHRGLRETLARIKNKARRL